MEFLWGLRDIGEYLRTFEDILGVELSGGFWIFWGYFYELKCMLYP